MTAEAVTRWSTAEGAPPAVAVPDAADAVRRMAAALLARFAIAPAPTWENEPLLSALATLLGPDLAPLVRTERSRLDPRRPRIVWLRVNGWAGTLEPDGPSLATRLAALPPEELEGLRRGRHLLLLDWSHEGRPYRQGVLDPVHAALAAHGIPPAVVALASQNLALAEPYRRAAARAGVEPIGVLAAHAHLTEYFARLFLAPADAQRAVNHRFGFALDGPAARPSRVVCLNYHLRPARALVVARLLLRGVPGRISFSAGRSRNPARRGAFWRGLEELSRPGESASNRVLVTPLLDQGVELEIDAGAFERANSGVFMVPPAAFRESELYVVTETEMSGPGLRRFTEKTLKAIVAGLPFVVFGNQGTVAALRRTGFDTLDDLVDHARYDDLADPAERLAGAWEAVERFLARPPGFTPAEMERLGAAARHNAAVFQTQLALDWILRPIAELCARHRPGHAGTG